jgi:hypothetical protein
MVKGQRLLATAATLMSAAAVAGCVSMPSSGPVLSPPTSTQDAGVSAQQYLQLDSEPPGANWGPEQIVEGFLAANGSFADDHKVAREYLSPQYKDEWSQDWSADVFKDGDIPVITVPPVPKSAETVVVTISGWLQARVTGLGTSYAVPAAPTNASPGTKQVTTITLTKTSEGWRISHMSRPNLLLSATDFQANYQQRDLYFFDPQQKHLVADPVYVPVAAVRAADPQELLKGLVQDLISPAHTWLVNATNTAIPSGTKLVNGVSVVGGVAVVSLEGSAIGRVDSATDERIAAQLLWTLAGSAGSQPPVTGVQLSINGKFWTPPNANANQVLLKTAPPFAGYGPPTGEAQTHTFYYLDNKGNVMGRDGPTARPRLILPASAKGPHLSTIAVSLDGKYLAGLLNGAIYIGPVGERLRSRASGGFTSVSWDPSDNLWAAGSDGLVVVPAAPGGAVMQVSPLGENITALRVAPDGVRVALVVNGAIQFGAIEWGTGGSTKVPAILPSDAFPSFEVSGSGISDVTWYGPDNVIALSGTGAGAQVTEYPVNGGAPTIVLHQDGMTNITASWNNPLIATTSSGQMLYTESIGGGWGPLSPGGNAAVYPG